MTIPLSELEDTYSPFDEVEIRFEEIQGTTLALFTEYKASMLKELVDQCMWGYHTHGISWFCDYLRTMIKDQTSKFIYFVTINPKEEELEEFVDRVHVVVKTSSYIQNCAYCFEQRGKTIDDMGKGYHCHMVFDYRNGNNPSQIRTNLFQRFKKFCASKYHIDVRKYTADFRADKLKYMAGDKWDTDKSYAVELNKVWRQKEELDDIYQK